VATLASCSIGIFPVVGILSLKKFNELKILILLVLSIVLPHSLITHKEHRFIFAAIPIFLILTAVMISDANFQRRSPKISNKNLFNFLITSVLVMSIFSSLLIFPLQGLIYTRTKFSHFSSYIFSQQPTLKAYLFLHREKNLVAVLNMSSPWYKTGGYYYLHHDIPIYFPEQLNFVKQKELGSYVSHIVCKMGHEDIPGFQAITRIGSLEIRKQTSPPLQYRSLNIDTQNVRQPEIDDNYIPTIKSRF